MFSFGDKLAEVSRRERAKRKRSAPKPRPRPAPAPDPITRAVRQVGRTATRAGSATNTGVGRAVARTPNVSTVRRTRRGAVDPEYAAIRRQIESAQRSGALGRAPVRVTPSRAGFSPEQIAEFRRRGLGRGGEGLGGLISNFGGDVVDVITGIPSAAQLGAKGVAYPAVLALEASGGLEDGVSEGIEDDYKAAWKSLKDDYSTRYGPLVGAYTDIASGRDPRQNLREFGSQAYQHPGLLALDVAGAYSAAGAGVRLGARAGARLTTGSTSQRLARMGSRAVTPGSVRYRPDRVRTVEMGENTARGVRGRSVATVSTPRRPYSANPLTRGVQRAVEGPAGRVAQRVERAADASDSPLLRPFSRQSKFNRSVARNARDYRLTADLNAERAVRLGTQDYVKAVRELDRTGISDLARRGGSAKWTREQVDAALYLHARDLLDVPGLKPTAARDRVIQFMREGLDEAVQTKGVKSSGAQRTIEAIASVPDELLDLRNAPPALQRAVAEYKKVSTEATEGRVSAGAITRDTAEAVNRRPAQMVHEGVTFNRKTGDWTSPRNPYTTAGQRGVYVPDIPRDRLKSGKQPGQTYGAFGRMTQDKVKQSHGTLFRQGNVEIDRGLPIKALERAVVDKQHPKFVEDFFDTFAFRRPNGDFSKGKRAVIAMEADPENVVLVSEKSLRDAMRLSRDLPDGQMPDNPLRALTTYEGDEGLAAMRDLKPGQRGDLVAFPKAAVDGMRQGWEGIKGGRMSWFDTPQSYWKRGILAFAPRWYVNSLFGNTLQYGMLTGGDIRSIMQARRSRVGNAVPERVTGSTNIAEARITDPRMGPRTKLGKAVTKTSDVGMNFQHRLDSIFRRAAYINRMKRGIRDEGGRFRRLTDDELIRAIDEAPAEVKNQALRETELFMGDYLRMTPMERATLRRIFPFYSWMRVIGRFMAVVPVKHPKRAALTAAVSRASADAVNPEDSFQRILANRGRINFGQNYSMRSAGLNPLFTHADLLKNATGRDWQGAASTLASNLSPVGLQQAARLYSGTTAFGAPVTYPAGYGGTAEQFGRSAMRLDPVTGLPDYYEPSVPFSEQLLQSIPLVPQIARGLASGGRRPYDTTTTLDLLLGGGDEGEMFMPDRDRGMEAIPTLGPLLGWAGVNVQRRDRAQEAKDYKKLIRDWEEAQRQTKARKRKAKRKER